MNFKVGELVRVLPDAIPGGPGTLNMVADGIGMIGIVVLIDKTVCFKASRYYVHLQSGQNNIYYYAKWLEKVTAK